LHKISKILLLAVLIVGLNTLGAALTSETSVYDFENGNTDGWSRLDSNSGTYSATTSRSYQGSYSIVLDADSNEVVVRAGFENSTHSSYTTYFNPDSYSSISDDFRIHQISYTDDGDTLATNARIRDNSIVFTAADRSQSTKWHCTDSQTYADSITGVTYDAWNELTVKFDYSSDTATVHFNGETRTCDWDSQANSIHKVQLTAQDSNMFYVDNVELPGVDNTVPSINSVSTEPESWTLGEAVDFSYNVSDGDGTVENVLLEVINSSSGTKLKEENFSYSSSSVSDTQVDWFAPNETGNYTVYYTATDDDGAESVQTLEKEATDTTPPSLTIHNPPNSTISTSSPDLNLTSDEPANYTYNVDGGTNTTVDEDDQDLNTSVSVSTGEHTVNVYANDSSGNIGYNSVNFTYQKAYVELGSGVEIDQPGNKATINITSSFNVSSLTAYNTATSFGGSNFSASGSLDNWINVKLDYYNASKGLGNFAVNFSAETVDGNNVSFKFTGLKNSSRYRVQRDDGRVFDQVTTDASGVVEFYQNAWTDNSYQSFNLLRTDNFIPEIASALFRENQESSITRIEFSLDDLGDTDISSYTGTGSQVTFTNSSLVLDVTLSVDSVYSVSDDSGLNSNDRSVNLDKTDSGVQEHSYSHNFSSQQVNRSTIYTNSNTEAVDYVLNHSIPGTVQSGGNFSGTVSGSSSKTLTSVTEADFLTDKEYGFSPSGSSVTLGVSYLGTRPLEVVNSEGVQFTGVNTSGFVTTPTSCSQNNASTVDVPASFNGNKSVEFSCDPGNNGNPTQTVNNITGGDRVWINASDMVIASNDTEETEIAVRTEKSKWQFNSVYDGGSLRAFVEGVSTENNTELNITDTGSYFRIEVGTSFQNSSLHIDDDEWSITYTNTDTSDDSTGGGGGGSRGGTSSTTVYFGAQGQPEENFGVPFEKRVERDLRITNTERRELTVNLRKGTNPVCDYITVRKSFSSSEFGEQGAYSMPEAVERFGSVEVSNTTTLRFDLPNKTYLENQGISDYTCSFETGSSYGAAEELTVKLDTSVSLLGRIVQFLTELGMYEPVSVDVPVASGSLSGDAKTESVTIGPVPKWQPLAGIVLLCLIGFGWYRRRK